jgi:hypothetical protein
MKFAKASVGLLLIQFAIVSSVAIRYLYQRSTCPRVWTQTAAYDPSLIMRGRYLSLQLVVDGCASTLPNAKQAKFPRDVNGVPAPGQFSIWAPGNVQFPAKLTVKDDKLQAIRLPESDNSSATQMVAAGSGIACDAMRLVNPVDFYIAEHATDPTHLQRGQELWIEVTVPPKGPPRPLQLAIKDSGAWKPLAFQ